MQMVLNPQYTILWILSKRTVVPVPSIDAEVEAPTVKLIVLCVVHNVLGKVIENGGKQWHEIHTPSQ